ncbi:hypothetical protein KQH89_21525, partial [Vibrio cholerae]|nr:hypothetical protein [Vibrio cholerae]
LRASLDYSKIQKEINVANYEKAIQTGFQEVSDGLAARATDKQQEPKTEYDSDQPFQETHYYLHFFARIIPVRRSHA